MLQTVTKAILQPAWNIRGLKKIDHQFFFFMKEKIEYFWWSIFFKPQMFHAGCKIALVLAHRYLYLLNIRGGPLIIWGGVVQIEKKKCSEGRRKKKSNLIFFPGRVAVEVFFYRFCPSPPKSLMVLPLMIDL